MTDLMHYEKGCSPSAIQRKYGLTYEQGYELAERLKKTQELELEVRRENQKLKDLLRGCKPYVKCVPITACDMEKDARRFLTSRIDEVLK